MSVVGDKNAIIGPATSQGLVAFDADGQIEPALAERWIVSDDGLSLAFRLTRTTWSNGRPVLAIDVARSLKESFALAANGRLGHVFNAVEDVVPMTERVVEIKLKVPRPNMLQLLAQPEFSVRHNGYGSGPFQIQKPPYGAITLRPVRAPDGSDENVTDDEMRAREIRVRGESAALGVTRYLRGQSQAMLGGSFVDYPLARSAQLRPSQMVIDPVRGLFGLAFVSRHQLIGEVEGRQALAMAIDRAALAQTLGLPNWQTREFLLPAQMDSAAPPASPDWAGQPIADRRAEAQRRIINLTRGGARPGPIRIALPAGPGAKLLFARIAADWGAIGVAVEPVDWRAPADVRLIDEVAPNGSVNWYFSRLGCGAGLMCDQASDDALQAARGAESLDLRAQAYAKADQAYAANAPFIVLGNPFRWALTSARLPGLRPSPFGVHPLIHIRAPRS
jgi:peptide/nickel transport system substrate-binding protein